ncbi:MAG: dTDP-3-amino-3,6-dideoxy-alpha-D-galactopyranose transaminase [candidate division BRC1 bacterium ADurb.BinA364]|nr:MAG: dTDP-3-amino-3,6-dideoxy-alpha-D-galactopyranose transaminase [candidate division BRC1 bacterium ADurb.BinA364]
MHLYGQCADMDPILAIAKARGLRVIEDAAQAHGAEYKGRRAGSMGDLGCFSFYCSKNLGAYGEAGMVVTSDPKLEATLRMLRDWGQEEKYKHKIKGYNARMDGIQGAILRVKFRHLEDWNESRRRHAALYRDALADASVRLPEELSHNRHVYHQFTIRHPRRDALREGLTRESIGWGIHYPIPAHLTEAHADLGYKAGDFPVAEEAAATVLSLPMFPEMTEEQARTVAAAVRRLSNGANA